jgi:hypothetical protein
MKHKIPLIFLIFIGVAGFMACDNGMTSDVKTISPEYRGKWEMVSFRFTSEPAGTNHVLPYTLSNGVIVVSGGYEIGDTYIKTYVNGIITQNTTDLYSSGNSIYNSAGQGGVTVHIDDNELTLTTVSEADRCISTAKFSWE